MTDKQKERLSAMIRAMEDTRRHMARLETMHPTEDFTHFLLHIQLFARKIDKLIGDCT
jgi:hypothetical protein